MNITAKVKKNKLKIFDESKRKIDAFKINDKNQSKSLLEAISLKYSITSQLKNLSGKSKYERFN